MWFQSHWAQVAPSIFQTKSNYWSIAVWRRHVTKSATFLAWRTVPTLSASWMGVIWWARQTWNHLRCVLSASANSTTIVRSGVMVAFKPATRRSYAQLIRPKINALRKSLCSISICKTFLNQISKIRSIPWKRRISHSKKRLEIRQKRAVSVSVRNS